jgi:hypothetical protein
MSIAKGAGHYGHSDFETFALRPLRIDAAALPATRRAAYSLERRRKVLPYKNPDDFERIVEGLRKAEVPEQ